MLISVLEQLNRLADSLSLVTNAVGPIEPGEKVEFGVLSSASDLLIADNALNLSPSLPVDVQVTWRVEDASGGQLTGNDFFSPTPLLGLNISFLFKPPIVELTGAPPNLLTRIIKARVRLRTLNLSPLQETVEKELSLPVQLVPLELPTILALFRHSKFRPFEDDMTPGFVLMIVPDGSPLQGLTGPTNDLLRRIEGALRPLRTFVGIASFLTGLGILSQALSAQPMARVRAGNVSDLDDIHMNTETFLGVDIFNRDMRANDRVSSLIFIGPPGRTVGLYNDEDFAEGEGFLKVHAGLEMVVLVPRLRLGTADLEAIPGVTVVRPDEDDNRFEDSLTSVQFLEDTPIDLPIP